MSALSIKLCFKKQLKITIKGTHTTISVSVLFPKDKHSISAQGKGFLCDKVKDAHQNIGPQYMQELFFVNEKSLDLANSACQ